MRAGKLRPVAVLAGVGFPPQVQALGSISAEVSPPAQDLAQAQTGLKAGGATAFRCRPSSLLLAGRYLSWNGRLFHIDAFHDPDGRNRSIAVAATELSGRPAIYRRGTTAIHLRAFVSRNNQYAAQYGRVPEYRTRIEVPRLELPLQPRNGDTLEAGGMVFEIEELAAGGDDGIVVQLVAKP